jgi:hypothetical protein
VLEVSAGTHRQISLTVMGFHHHTWRTKISDLPGFASAMASQIFQKADDLAPTILPLPLQRWQISGRGDVILESQSGSHLSKSFAIRFIDVSKCAEK